MATVNRSEGTASAFVPRAAGMAERGADALVSRIAAPVRAIGTRALGLADEILRNRLGPLMVGAPRRNGEFATGMTFALPWYERPMGRGITRTQSKAMRGSVPTPSSERATASAPPIAESIGHEVVTKTTGRESEPVILAADAVPLLNQHSEAGGVEQRVGASPVVEGHATAPVYAANASVAAPTVSGLRQREAAAVGFSASVGPSATDTRVADAVPPKSTLASSPASGDVERPLSSLAGSELRAAAFVAEIGRKTTREERDAGLPWSLSQHLPIDDRLATSAVVWSRLFAHAAWADVVAERAMVGNSVGVGRRNSPEISPSSEAAFVGAGSDGALLKAGGELPSAGATHELRRPQTPVVDFALVMPAPSPDVRSIDGFSRIAGDRAASAERTHSSPTVDRHAGSRAEQIGTSFSISPEINSSMVEGAVAEPFAVSSNAGGAPAFVGNSASQTSSTPSNRESIAAAELVQDRSQGGMSTRSAAISASAGSEGIFTSTSRNWVDRPLQERMIDDARPPIIGFTSSLLPDAPAFVPLLSRFVAGLTGVRTGWDVRPLPLITPNSEGGRAGAFEQRRSPMPPFEGAMAAVSVDAGAASGSAVDRAVRTTSPGSPSSRTGVRQSEMPFSTSIDRPAAAGMATSEGSSGLPVNTAAPSTSASPVSVAYATSMGSSAGASRTSSKFESSGPVGGHPGQAAHGFSWRPGSFAGRSEQMASSIGVRAAGMSLDFVDVARLPLLASLQALVRTSGDNPGVAGNSSDVARTSRFAPSFNGIVLDATGLTDSRSMPEFAKSIGGGGAAGGFESSESARRAASMSASDVRTVITARTNFFAAPSTESASPSSDIPTSSQGARFGEPWSVETSVATRQLRDAWALLNVFPGTSLSSLELFGGASAAPATEERLRASSKSAVPTASAMLPGYLVSSARAGSFGDRGLALPVVTPDDRPMLPGGRAPRGSFTWPRTADFADHFKPWEPSTGLAAAAAAAEVASSGTPLWGSLPSVPALITGSALDGAGQGESAGNGNGSAAIAKEVVSGAAALRLSGAGSPGRSPMLSLLREASSSSAGDRSLNRGVEAVAREGSRSGPIASLLEQFVTAVGASSRSTSSANASSARSWTPPNLTSVDTPSVRATPSNEASARMVDAVRAQSQSSGSDDRVSLADLTLIAVASATQQIAAKSTDSQVPAPGAPTGRSGGSSQGGSGSHKSPEAEQREIDEIAHQVLDEVQRMLEIAGERSGNPWQS